MNVTKAPKSAVVQLRFCIFFCPFTIQAYPDVLPGTQAQAIVLGLRDQYQRGFEHGKDLADTGARTSVKRQIRPLGQLGFRVGDEALWTEYGRVGGPAWVAMGHEHPSCDLRTGGIGYSSMVVSSAAWA